MMVLMIVYLKQNDVELYFEQSDVELTFFPDVGYQC